MRYLMICLTLALAGIGFAGCGGGSDNVTTPVPVVARGTFTVSAPQQASKVAQGASATFAIMAASTGTFSDPVALTVTGLPAGATAAFDPASVKPTFAGTQSMLTVTTSAGKSATPAGTYPLTITA